jgi:hypothetical protein
MARARQPKLARPLCSLILFRFVPWVGRRHPTFAGRVASAFRRKDGLGVPNRHTLRRKCYVPVSYFRRNFELSAARAVLLGFTCMPERTRGRQRLIGSASPGSAPAVFAARTQAVGFIRKSHLQVAPADHPNGL